MYVSSSLFLHFLNHPSHTFESREGTPDCLVQTFRIGKMSRVLVPGLRHASSRWLNLLARNVGRHDGYFKKGTWIQSTCM